MTDLTGRRALAPPSQVVGDRETSAAASSGNRSGMREFLRLLSRHKWQLLFTTISVCCAAGLVMAFLTPEYRATALVMLDTRKATLTRTLGGLIGGSADATAVQTEIEVLKSQALLGRVVDKLNLGADPEFGSSPVTSVTFIMHKALALLTDWTQSAASKTVESSAGEGPRARAIVSLARDLNVTPIDSSYVIGISADSVDPAKATKIVGTVTDLYVVDQLQAKLDANTRATEFYNERLDELKNKVETSERAVAAFREKSGLTVGKGATIANQSLSELNTQLIQARAQRADREARLVALKEAQKKPATLGAISEVVNNPLIASLRSQEAEVARRIGDLTQRYGDSHPRLLQARAELGQIQGRIGAEISKIFASVEGDAEAARAKEAELQEQVGRLERQAGGLGQEEAQLGQLERDAQSSRAIYEDFLKHSKEFSGQQDIQQPDARILSAATVLPEAVYPRYGLVMSLALAAGLLLGVVLIALFEWLRGGFRTGDQVERLTGHALIGMIPALSRRTLGKLLPATFAIEKPSSAYSESLRSAYTAVKLGGLDRLPKVIMITSSVPGEGKSTFACSLAGLLARSNTDKKIVIVDCDLRRASVLKSLAIPDTGGSLDEYLTGRKPLEQVVGRDPVSGLYFVAARANTPNSAEILDSKMMHSFVRSLSGTFDVVLLDTPPLMAVSDTRVIATTADYIIFLVRWEQTARAVAINCLKLLRDSSKNIGVVLSQVNVRRHARYGYGDYGYYYSKYRDYYSN